MVSARCQTRGDGVFENPGLALALALAVVNLAFTLKLFDVFRRSWRSIQTREAKPDLPTLSIIVPARNEERNIARCVSSLLASSYPAFELIVVDDRSTDATRSILDALAAGDERLRVVTGAALPDGWVGKPWALAQGARVAREAWLLFTDADTEHEALAAASAVQCACGDGYDVVSLLTDQETIGAAERLFLPTILLVIMLGVGAVDDINDPRKPDVALFNGQYILVSAAAYAAIGGHEGVRGEIAEDLELARRFKRSGRFRTFLGGSNGLVRTRMYASFREIWQGFVKNFAIGARGRVWGAVVGTTVLACVSPLSPIVVLWLLIECQWLAAAVLALSGAGVVAVAEIGMRRIHFRPGSGLALPMGLPVTLAIFVTSVYCTFVGRGVEWRGRRYGGGLRGLR